MTIKRDDRENGISYVFETRTHRFTLASGWEVSITQGQHSTLINGVEDRKDPQRLEVFVKKDGVMYKGGMWIHKDGSGYTAENWKKANVNVDWRPFDHSKIANMLDAICVTHLSHEGQREMLTQTIANADSEIQELQARINLIQSWATNLRRERTEIMVDANKAETITSSLDN